MNKNIAKRQPILIAVALLMFGVFGVVVYMQWSSNPTETIEEYVRVEDNVEETDTSQGNELAQNKVSENSENKDDPQTAVAKDVQQEDTAAPAKTVMQRPVIDTIRIEENGSVVLAGTAAGLSKLRVLLDEKSIIEENIDPSGTFALLFDIESSETARRMTLVSLINGEEIFADQDVIISPSVVRRSIEVVSSENAMSEPEHKISPIGDEDTDRTRDQASSSTESAQEAESTLSQDTKSQPESDPNKTESVVLMVDQDGVNVVQSDALEAERELDVETIAYDDTGDVSLAGRGSPTGSVRIYLNNRPISTAAMDALGQWSTALSEIDAGVYTLRVDELDAAGKVTSRLETPFKRERVEDLAQYASLADTPARINVVTVQPGNTLWALARDRYGEGILYVRVFDANKDKIRDPNLIYPGQVFQLPSE